MTDEQQKRVDALRDRYGADGVKVRPGKGGSILVRYRAFSGSRVRVRIYVDGSSRVA